MKPKYKGKHFVTLEDWDRQGIDDLLEVSKQLKKKFRNNETTDYLKNKTSFLMFFEQSTRTRNSMEAGIAQLGGHGNFLDTSTMQISHGETGKDTAIILSSYGHAIACRNCFWKSGNAFIREMERHASVPVMNLQCDLYHPFQGLADLMTIQEVKGRTSNIKVSIIWAYATSHKKPISVPLTQSLLFPRYGMDVVLAHPKGWELPEWVIDKARKNAEANGGSFKVTNNMEEAYQDADIIIPKNWGSWASNESDDVIDEALEANRHWKCTEAMMKRAKPDCNYMHALPADRGNEVEDSVIDGPQSVVYQEAENRLHTAKAVMTMTMGDK